MQSLYINASLKKSDNSYLHQFFFINNLISNCNGSQLVVPPVKEWYIIPRVRPLYPNIPPNNLLNLTSTSKTVLKTISDSRQIQFCLNLLEYPYCFRPNESDIKG